MSDTIKLPTSVEELRQMLQDEFDRGYETRMDEEIKGVVYVSDDDDDDDDGYHDDLSGHAGIHSMAVKWGEGVRERDTHETMRVLCWMAGQGNRHQRRNAYASLYRMSMDRPDGVARLNSDLMRCYNCGLNCRFCAEQRRRGRERWSKQTLLMTGQQMYLAPM